MPVEEEIWMGTYRFELGSLGIPYKPLAVEMKKKILMAWYECVIYKNYFVTFKVKISLTKMLNCVLYLFNNFSIVFGIIVI